MTESRFLSEILASIRKLPRALAEPHEGRTGRGPRYTPPWDAYALVDGKFFALEAKCLRGPSYPIDKIPERQIEGLKKARACGAQGAAFVVRGVFPEAVVVSPENMARAIREARAAGRKSVTWAAMLSCRSMFVLRNGGDWGVRGMLAGSER